MTNQDLPAADVTTRHVRGAVEGNLESLCWLVERFSPLLHAVAANRLGATLRASYDPADVVQDVWMSVLPKLGALELRGSRTTPVVLKYLTTAVVNRVRNLLQKHLTRQLTGDLGVGGREELEDPASGVLTKAARSESGERVQRAIDELLGNDRQILILRGLEQQPLSAVAEQLRIEAGTAAVRYHRALKRLQQQLPDSVFADLEVADA